MWHSEALKPLVGNREDNRHEAAQQCATRITSGKFTGDDWFDMTEYQYVWFLYRLRKDALTIGDRRQLARLNQTPPPASESVA